MCSKKFIAITAYIKKDVKSIIFHLKSLEKEQTIFPKQADVKKQTGLE